MNTKQLVTQESQAPQEPSAALIPSPLAILEAAVRGGITSDSVAVVKELAAMCREQRAEEAKAEFARAFFALKSEMPMIYADKEVKTKSGAVAFEYCSPQEIQNTIDPLLKKHGFCTMTGQAKEPNGFVTATVTLFHQAGHSETRSFTVRAGSGNSLMTETQCDAGATTNAERHLLIKMLGLRTRAHADDDHRNVGHPITADQAADLDRRCVATKTNRRNFLDFLGVDVDKGGTFSDVMSSRYADADAELKERERKQSGGNEPAKDKDGNFIF